VQHLYAIAALGQVDAVKFGVASDVRRRLRTLQCGSPVALEVRRVWNDGGNIEPHIHKHLSEYRLGGEWFRWSAEPVQELMALDLPELAERLLGPDVVLPLGSKDKDAASEVLLVPRRMREHLRATLPNSMISSYREDFYPVSALRSAICSAGYGRVINQRVFDAIDRLPYNLVRPPEMRDMRAGGVKSLRADIVHFLLGIAA
jgi:hypothetical protein